MAFRLQSNFTKGEIGETMLARVDYEGYFKGALRLRNVLILPQGGVRRRFGTEYVAAVTDISADNQVQMTILEYADDTFYVVVFADLKIFIYHDDALVATVVSPFNDTDVPSLNFVQTSNSLLIVHPDYAPRHLYRTSAHAGWTLSTPTFKDEPGFDFSRNYSGFTFTLQDGAGGTFDTAENISGQAVRFICSNNFFTAAMVGGRAFMYGGVINYDTFSSATRMDGTITKAFDMKVDSTFTFDPTSIPGKDVVSTEPCFSATRGYPSHVENYQNRVIFANTASLPDGLFCSAFNGFYNDEFDFDDSRTSADSAFTLQIGSKRTDAIRSLQGDSTLLIFTKSGEHSTNPLNDRGFSFDNASITLQGTEGIALQVAPVSLDSKVLFAEDGGKIVSGMVYSAVKQKFEPINFSLLASHLIKNPRKILTYKNPSEIDGKLLLCINSDDGSLAILQLIEEQNIIGWSLATTPGATGEFITGASAGNKTYFLVKRNVNSSDVYYLEKLNFDLLTDSAKTGTNAPASATITGLGHLEAEEVKIISGNRVVGTETVASGEVTVDSAIGEYEVGLNFTTQIRPMPVVIATKLHPTADPYEQKHINTVYIDYYESLGIKVNGVSIPFRSLGESEFFDPDPQSGVYAMTLMEGWDPRVAIEITQDEPYPLTLRGIGYLVDFEGDK